MKRVHWQISKLYMSDSGSKIERFSALKRYLKGMGGIFFNDCKYRLTTPDGKVYISEPDGMFYRILKVKNDMVDCPVLKEKISIHKNDITKVGCIKCAVALSVNNECVHCKEQ